MARATGLVVEALFELAHFLGELVEELHAAHEALGFIAAGFVIPAGGKRRLELGLGRAQAALERGHTIEIGGVLKVFQLFAPLHLLQQEAGILDGRFKRQLAPLQRQQVERAPWALRRTW